MSLQVYADLLAGLVESSNLPNMDVAQDFLGTYDEYYNGVPDQEQVVTSDGKHKVTADWAIGFIAEEGFPF